MVNVVLLVPSETLDSRLGLSADSRVTRQVSFTASTMTSSTIGMVMFKRVVPAGNVNVRREIPEKSSGAKKN